MRERLSSDIFFDYLNTIIKEVYNHEDCTDFLKFYR